MAAADFADIGAEGSEAPEMDVQRPLADPVTAGGAAGSTAEAGEERAHDKERGALIGDEAIGRRVAERTGGREMERVGSRVDSDIGTEVFEDGAE